MANIKNNRDCLYFIYNGGSMYPTLREFDVLEVLPYNERRIVKGDIICFPSSSGQKIVAHRVVGLHNKILHTQGDNSRYRDSWETSKGDVLGRVEAIWRHNKRRRIKGGFEGSLAIWRIRMFDKNILRLLCHIYHYILPNSIGRCIGKKIFNPRVIIFNEDKSTKMVLVFAGRRIGRYNNLFKQWQIDPPFGLIVDADELPGFSK